MYQAVFFDLDGTLLPIDTRAFMSSYFDLLGAFFARAGVDGRTGLEGIRVGTQAMFAYDGATTNEERFWDAFVPFMDGELADKENVPKGRRAWEGLLGRFYAEEFPRLREGIEPGPLAALVVDALRAKGYRLLLATNPLFPPEATAQRLAWTGVDARAFERVTAYHNSRYAKPTVEYYEENLAALGLTGPDVLMVGNDPVEDHAACACGCSLYLVTDNLVDRDGAGADLAATPHGTLADLLAYVQGMPKVR